MVNNSNSKMALNLSFFITAKSEDESSFLKLLEVCGCVEKKVKASWSKGEYESFERELNQYAEKMNNFFEQDKLTVVALSTAAGLPKPTIKLQNKLKNISPFVYLCENEHNTQVEF